MTITVRTAEPADLERVGELTALAYIADGLLSADHAYVAELQDAVRRHDHATVLVAVEQAPDGEAVLGTITIATPDSPYAEIAAPDELELRMLAVDPGARRRGIGELLMREAIERGLGWGAQRVVLSTMTTMTTAQRMYERLGMRREPERDWEIAGYSMKVYTASA
jgi:ribosomal protein S18 acetylase RimI-like enzyme